MSPSTRRGRLAELIATLARFTVVGGSTTALYALLYLGAVEFLPPHPANAAAMVLSTVVSTEWHRRWTFRSDRGGLRAHLQAGLVTTVTYAMTSSALVLLESVRPGSGDLAQVAAIVVATTVAGLIRFAVLRAWVFARRQQAPPRRGSSELDTRYRPGSDTFTTIQVPSVTKHARGPSTVNQRLCRTRTSTSADSAVSNVTPVGSEVTSRPGYCTSDVDPTTS
ncbi:MAG TPA: GtrA family protein [Mycobacteriales bacterium]